MTDTNIDSLICKVTQLSADLEDLNRQRDAVLRRVSWWKRGVLSRAALKAGEIKFQEVQAARPRGLPESDAMPWTIHADMEAVKLEIRVIRNELAH